MIYVYFFATAYLSMGLGFSIASWLQAAEIEVNETGGHGSFFSGQLPWFVFLWPIVALFCYKKDVKKTISEEHYQMKMKEFKDKYGETGKK